MYQGTNKTALCSQKQIAQALVRLMKDTPYPAISISAVCKSAGVSRQTFYSLFESKENIILYILGKNHGFTPGQSCCGPALSLSGLSREYSCYIADHREFLELLVKNDIIYLLHDSLYRSFISCPHFLSDLSEQKRCFGAEFLSGGLSGIARIYAENSSVTTKELESTIADLFSGRFFQNL